VTPLCFLATFKFIVIASIESEAVRTFETIDDKIFHEAYLFTLLRLPILTI